MVIRIALGLVAAIRAALIYGDGAELAARRIELPRWMRSTPAWERSRVESPQGRLGWR